MKLRLHLFFRLGLFWLSYFILMRIFFLFYNHQLAFDLPFNLWIGAFAHGFRLDLSLTGYILAVSGLFISLSIPFPQQLTRLSLKIINLTLLVIFTIIAVSDFELYRNWGFRMDTTPLLYISKPKEALASLEVWLVLALLATMAGLFLGFLFYWRAFVSKKIDQLHASKWWWCPVFLFITASMIIPVRGGVGIAPINTGAAYFSNERFANHAALNVLWNLGYELSRMDDSKRDYNFVDDEKATEEFSWLASESINSKKVLRSEHPNIVLIILESFTSKLIEPLGGKAHITPHFNRYAEKGILFTRFYANASRSDKGIAAILSGYPAHPTASVIKYTRKTEQLPSLAKDLARKGYNSSFYYGGDIDFANMRSYVINCGFEQLVTMKDFDPQYYNSKWGVHDHVMFERLLADIEKDTSRFFKVLFTLSSHEPFDVPMETVVQGNSRPQKFMNSIVYTDRHLGRFLDNMAMSPAWDNSLIILIADHGSPRPGNSASHEPEKFQIPMLWTGGALKDTLKYHHTASQKDLAKTLLSQLKVENDHYPFSLNLFADSLQHYAYYAFNEGFGFITDSSATVYGHDRKAAIIEKPGKNEKELELGKVFLQIHSHDFVQK